MRPTQLRLLPLCLAIAGAVRAEQPAPPTWILCANPESIPLFSPLVESAGNRTDAPTDIDADALNVQKSESTTFSGNVQMRHADQWLNTETLTYLHDSQQFSVPSPMRFQDHTLRMTADSAAGDQIADTLDLNKVQYQFNQELGNGSAEHAHMQGDTGTLTSATYSTCPPAQRQWEFAASHIKINQQTATGTARNVTLRLGGVPVIWLPFVAFPTDDKRRSGVLSPTIGRDDRNGLDFRLPIYFNLAPNYDATLAPRWLSKRGLMNQGEFRYLSENSRGTFEGTWLHNDDITGRDRSLVNFKHQTFLNAHWNVDAKLGYVSDREYLSDFGESIDNTSISFIDSQAGISGRGLNWTARLAIETWQIANPFILESNAPYQRLPRLQVHVQQPLTHWLKTGFEAEAVRFSHESLDGGQRIDLQPFIAASLGGNAWFINPKLAWRYTSYNLDPGLVAPGESQSPSRSLPVLSLDAGSFFERDLHWGNNDLIQTLEPRLFYLRVPYRDQDALPVFDTRELTFGWTSLFRDNRFGGGDRQTDANQLTMALTSRLLSTADGRERLSTSVGRIRYFDAPQVTLPGSLPIASNSSDWIVNFDVALNDNWKLGVTHQWDPDSDDTRLSSVHTQLRFGNGSLFNAAYRFRRDSLEQTDLSFVIPVDGNWNLYGRWNYSLDENKTIEALAGFEWKSCCVAVRLLGRQYIRSFSSQENIGVYLEIELNGLGSFGRDTTRLLDNAILGYSR